MFRIPASGHELQNIVITMLFYVLRKRKEEKRQNSKKADHFHGWTLMAKFDKVFFCVYAHFPDAMLYNKLILENDWISLKLCDSVLTQFGA